MAYIDKTYTASWEEYQEVSKWMRDHTFICPNGCKVRMGDYLFHWTRDEFDENPELEKPIFSTGWVEDYFLINHCPLPIVQDRMKEVYGEEHYEEMRSGKSEWDTYEDRVEYGTGFRIIKRPKMRYNRCIRNFYKGKPIYGEFFIDVEHNDLPLEYNKSINRWIDRFNGELGVQDVFFFSGVKTIRGLIRKIRGWKLPKGTVIKATGRYPELDWIFEII